MVLVWCVYCRSGCVLNACGFVLRVGGFGSLFCLLCVGIVWLLLRFVGFVTRVFVCLVVVYGCYCCLGWIWFVWLLVDFGIGCCVVI